jgi:hypothetical protein
VNIIKNKAEDKRMNEKKALSPPRKEKYLKTMVYSNKTKEKKNYKISNGCIFSFHVLFVISCLPSSNRRQSRHHICNPI